jgi:hypothetical protein
MKTRVLIIVGMIAVISLFLFTGCEPEDWHDIWSGHITQLNSTAIPDPIRHNYMVTRITVVFDHLETFTVDSLHDLECSPPIVSNKIYVLQCRYNKWNCDNDYRIVESSRK